MSGTKNRARPKKSPKRRGESRLDLAECLKAVGRLSGRPERAGGRAKQPLTGDLATAYACWLIRRWSTIELLELIPTLERFARPIPPGR